jgi:hypothetical protein
MLFRNLIVSLKIKITWQSNFVHWLVYIYKFSWWILLFGSCAPIYHRIKTQQQRCLTFPFALRFRIRITVNLQAITRKDKIVLSHLQSLKMAYYQLWNIVNCSSSSIYKFMLWLIVYKNVTCTAVREVFNQWSKIRIKAVNLASKERNMVGKVST